MNVVVLAGVIDREPQTRDAGGKKVTSFSVKVNEDIKGKVYTTFVPCQVWDKDVRLGQVFVEGKFRTDSWDDKQSGDKRTRSYVSAFKVTQLGGGSGGGQMPPTPSPQTDFSPF